MIRAARAIVLIMLVVATMPAWSATATIPLMHLPAPLVQSWLADLIKTNSVGIAPGSIQRVDFVAADNVIAVEGDAAALETIRALVKAADVPRRQVVISVRMVDIADPTPLLGTPWASHSVSLPDGTSVPGPAPIARGLEAPRDEALASPIAINPFVDEALIEKLVDAGQATVIHQAYAIAEEGVRTGMQFGVFEPGDPTPREHTARYSLAATAGEGDMVTVEVTCSYVGPAPDHAELGPVQYVARLGQAVALCTLVEDAPTQLVYVVTVTAVE